MALMRAVFFMPPYFYSVYPVFVQKRSRTARTAAPAAARSLYLQAIIL